MCIYQPFQYCNSDAKWYVTLILRADKLHWKMSCVSFGPIEARLLFKLFRWRYGRKYDETNFFFNMDNGRTLGFKFEANINYINVVYGGQHMTLSLRLSCGAQSKNAFVIVIFCNENRIYPVRGVPNTLKRVSHRSNCSGLMDGRTFVN